MYKALRVFLVALLLSGMSSAYAEDDVVLGIGAYDIGHGGDSANFSGEWRMSRIYYDLRPLVGLDVNADGSVYGYAGVDYDWQFAPHWALVPELAVGAWSRGDGVDLGGTLEFHEAIEVDYKFDNNYRVGAQFSHTSNAGIYSSNPGAQSLMATFTVPFNYR